MTSVMSRDANGADSMDCDYRAALVAAQPEARRADVHAFFELIEAPVNLRGIALVMPVVVEALKILSVSADTGASLWAQTWINVTKEVTQILNAGQFNIPGAGRRRLRTLCEKNPIYAAVLCASSNRAMSTAGTHVLAYVLHALARDREQLSRHQVRQVGRAFRYFIAHNTGLEVLKQISGDATTPIGLAKEIVQARDAQANKDPTCTNYVYLVEKLLEGKLHRSVLKKGRPPGSGGGSGLHGESPRMPVITQATIALGDGEAGDGRRDIRVVAEQEDTERLRDGMRSGLSSKELTQTSFVETPASDGHGLALARGPGSRVLRARDTSDHIASHNHQFSWQWSQLSWLELYRCYETALGMCAGNVPGTSIDPDLHRTAVLALSVLHLSQRPEQTALLHWATDVPDGDRANHIKVERGPRGWQGVWYRPALIPVQTETLAHVNCTLLLTISPYVILPIPGWLAKIYGEWKAASSGQDGGPVFGIEPAAAKNVLSKFCKALRDRYRGCRITKARLTHYFFQRALQNQDIGNVEASQMFSRDSHLTASQMHYTATPLNALIRKYAAMCESIADEMREEARARGATGVLDMLIPEHPQRVMLQGGLGECERYVGSQLVPLTAAVKRSLRALQAKMKKERAEAKNGWVRRFHNYFTLYTVLFLSWGSGLRAVCYPVPDPRLLDVQNGRLVISDKDDADGSMTRLVFVPDSVCAQVKSYYEHLVHLPGILFYGDMGCAGELAAQIRGYSERVTASMTQRRGRIEERNTSPFFLLDRNLVARPLGPKTLFEQLGKDYPFPANGHRHYLRTHLVATGMADYLVDAFLGHAAHGCEPFTGSSALSMSGYATELRTKLSVILDDLGWKVMEGLV